MNSWFSILEGICPYEKKNVPIKQLWDVFFIFLYFLDFS
jgi:hypothetical protein